jgi:hypothetical protein
LAIDALLPHPGKASGNVAQGLRYRPGRLAAGEGKGEAAALLDDAQRGKARAVATDRVEKIGRHQMGMGIDDHRSSQLLTAGRTARVVPTRLARAPGLQTFETR